MNESAADLSGRIKNTTFFAFSATVQASRTLPGPLNALATEP